MIPLSIMAIQPDDDRSWMTALYQRHYPLMYAMAKKYAKQQTDADDIVSQSCEALIRHIDVIRTLPEPALQAYIATTTRNTAINYLRKQQRYEHTIQLTEHDELMQIPREAFAEERVLLSQQVDRVLCAIQTLPERDRDVLRMKYQQQLSDSAMAERLNTSQANVRQLISRARKRLKIALHGEVEQ